MTKIVIVSHNIDSAEEFPGQTKIYQMKNLTYKKILKWGEQFGELMESELLDGYRRIWYKTPSGGQTVVEYLEDKEV